MISAINLYICRRNTNPFIETYLVKKKKFLRKNCSAQGFVMFLGYIFERECSRLHNDERIQNSCSQENEFQINEQGKMANRSNSFFYHHL